MINSSLLALGLGVGAVLWIALVHLTKLKVDAREPPVIAPTVPFVGHIIGMFREGPQYLKRIGAKTNAPIFTLQMLSGRTYIAKDPVMTAQLQRSSSTLSFQDLIIEVSPRMGGMGASGIQLMRNNKELIHKIMHGIIPPNLSPQGMEKDAVTQLQFFADFANKIPREGRDAELFKLISRQVTLASMHTFYGPENPMAMHPDLVEAFWDWESNVIGIVIGVYPKYTARKAYLGLEKLAAGFREYYEKGEEGGVSKASEMIRKRWQHHVAMGTSLDEQARLEIGMCLGINVNAAITAFWNINSICSRPNLLAEVRKEIETYALVDKSTISFRSLRDSCPLLNSIYRETMRITSPLTSARYVLEDTIVADTYLLRKGTVVQMSGYLLHNDPNIWGPDANSFNPHRFLYTPNGTKSAADGTGTIPANSKADQVHHAAYRSFGGGSSLCPGRHFAQMEILALTAVLVAGFDLGPPEGKKEIAWNPKFNEKEFPIASLKPVGGLHVRLRRREGFEDVEWGLRF